MDKLDRRIYISLPDEKLHEGHAVGEVIHWFFFIILTAVDSV